MINMKESTTIIGAGSWGLAIALHLAKNNKKVCIYVRKKISLRDLYFEKLNIEIDTFSNSIYKNLVLSYSIGDAIKKSNDLVIAVPCSSFLDVVNKIKIYISDKNRIICATKGIEPKTHQLLSNVISSILGNIMFCVLSGPSFASEVIQGLPVSITVASKDKKLRNDMYIKFNSDIFLIEKTSDITGVQISSAIKNIIAIASGISVGFNLGENALSIIITKGFSELLLVGKKFGAKRKTFLGTSGIGDLILTCTSNKSRNRKFGISISSNKNADIENHLLFNNMKTVEGLTMAKNIEFIQNKFNIKLTICNGIAKILKNKKILNKNFFIKEFFK